MTDAATCGCGCGLSPHPGRTYLHGGHSSRARGVDRGGGAGEYVTCPRCGSRVRVCLDGTLGMHWMTSGRAETRLRCPGGRLPVEAVPVGRRVRVVVDVVLPVDGWDVTRVHRAVADTLRLHLGGGVHPAAIETTFVESPADTPTTEEP